MNKKHKRRGGLYFLPGEDRPYLTVTKILSVIDKPALVYWAAGIVYDRMVVDPSIEKRTALAATREESQKAAARGTTVHDIIEAHKKGAPRITTIPQYQGYVDAFYQWFEDNDVEILDAERTVISRKYAYAGTLDLRMRINGKEDVWITDFKTGKNIYDEVQLQLSAYNQCLMEDSLPQHRQGVVLLGEDRTYKFEEKVFEIEPFLCAKKLYEWKNKSALQKYGYLL